MTPARKKRKMSEIIEIQDDEEACAAAVIAHKTARNRRRGAGIPIVDPRLKLGARNKCRIEDRASNSTDRSEHRQKTKRSEQARRFAVNEEALDNFDGMLKVLEDEAVVAVAKLADDPAAMARILSHYKIMLVELN